MNQPLTIKNINNTSEYKFKEKGSLFIGIAIPVTTEDNAIDKLTELRKKYYDATHNCYTYLLTNGKSKYSDDGEPNGTAGVRILNAINHFELSDILLVVTRYFGGTKLGVGPLGKAYYDCALKTLEQSERTTKHLFRRIIIEYPFDLSNLVHRTLTKYSAKIEQSKFEESPSLYTILPEVNIDKFIEEIQSNSSTKVKTLITNDIVYI